MTTQCAAPRHRERREQLGTRIYMYDWLRQCRVMDVDQIEDSYMLAELVGKSLTFVVAHSRVPKFENCIRRGLYPTYMKIWAP